MKRSPLAPEAQRQKALLFTSVIFSAIAVSVGLWQATGVEKKTKSLEHVVPIRLDTAHLKPAGVRNVGATIIRGTGVEATLMSDRRRQPLQFRAKEVEPAAVLAVLASGKQTVEERVRHLQGMRGISFSKEERETAMVFLAGQQVPEDMSKGSMHWLADELLSALRLQEPPWDGLADELVKVAYQPGTDPVVRDYIMQHLGHLWEQNGASKEIDAALWRALDSQDEITPGTALIALSAGYARDQNAKALLQVQQRALILAQNPNTPLAVRVTALSIAEEGGSSDMKTLAANLLKNPETPVILRKVAETVVR